LQDIIKLRDAGSKVNYCCPLGMLIVAINRHELGHREPLTSAKSSGIVEIKLDSVWAVEACYFLTVTPVFLLVDFQQTGMNSAVTYLVGGAVAQRVERWTCDQQVVGSNPTRGKNCLTTLGKLFTPMCLCHRAV